MQCHSLTSYTNLICTIWRLDENKMPFLNTVSSTFISYREPRSCSACYCCCIFSSSSLASVNGPLQTNYNNNLIFPHNDCSAVCVQARDRRCSKLKLNMSVRSVHLYIQYRLILVKVTCPEGYFDILLCVFAQSRPKPLSVPLTGYCQSLIIHTLLI